MRSFLLDYTLRLADNASILSHRLGEWCGHGPILEQDIALTNVALDDIGQARSLYQYAAEQVNHMSAAEREKLFSDVGLRNKIASGEQIDEDDLAFLRDGWDYRNFLLLEQPNKDWAYTVARSFCYDVYTTLFYAELQKSKDETLAAIAEKSLKEVAYHQRWSCEWVIRLGDGTEESHKRMQDALNDVWMFTGEMFTMDQTDKVLVEAGIAVDVELLRSAWHEKAATVIEEATLTLPADSWMQKGGKEGKHTEHLGYILADMQYLQRTYPGMDW